MNENRRKILEMLSRGQITTDEAERLLAALEKDPAAAEGASEPSPKAKPKYLRIQVESSNRWGPETVNVRVPMQLLRAGVKLANFVPDAAREQVNDALKREGVPFELNEIKADNLEELLSHLDDITIDVNHEHKKEKVRVFCE